MTMHAHGHAGEKKDFSTLSFAALLTLFVFFAELLGGFFSNSLSLLGDAGHVFSDVLALGIAALALWLASKPATSKRTFGYHRLEVFAAVLNGVLLIAIAFWIILSAFARFNAPPAIDAPLALGVSFFGLIANLYVVFKLHGHSNININAAFWHAASDALSSVGVVVSSAIIMLTGLFWVDAAMSLLISVLILLGAYRVILPAAHILLESVPLGLHTHDFERELGKVKGVDKVHDLHVWSICSEVVFVSAHLVVKNSKISETSRICAAANCMLKEKFNIAHATFQFETKDYACNACGKNGVCDPQHCLPQTPKHGNKHKL